MGSKVTPEECLIALKQLAKTNCLVRMDIQPISINYFGSIINNKTKQ